MTEQESIKTSVHTEARHALPFYRLQEPGPRFRVLCEEHLKLPKKKQDEVLAKWAEKNA